VSKHIIITNEFPIQPSDIDVGIGKKYKHLFGAFDNSETEVSANYVVRLCQKKGGWLPFTLEEIEEFYRELGHRDGFRFNRLIEPGQKVLNAAAVFGGATPQTKPVGGGWIVLGDDKKYYITDDFVTRCFQSSPTHSVKKQTS